MIPTSETRNYARLFFEKFGYRDTLSVEDFDIFIIDHKLAKDPETSDTSDPRHRNFVTERSLARNKLNKGGAYCEDGAFTINVVKPGKLYSITAWTDSSLDFAKEIGNQVADYAQSRRARMQSLSRQADKMLDLDPSNTELLEVSQMLGFMAREGLQLQAKVKGLVNQFNVAADAVERQFAALTQQKYEFESAGELEHLGS